MPEYRFKAIGFNGEPLEGQEHADNPSALETRLRRRRFSLIEAKEIRPKPIPLKTTTDLLSELSWLLSGGVSIDRALDIVAQEEAKTPTGKLANALRQRLKQGHSLSESMRDIGQFDSLVVPMVATGEASGKLAEVFEKLARHFEEQEQTRRELIGSLTYPAILFVASIASLILLSIYLVPIFQGLFEGREEMVPALTRFVFAASGAIKSFGPVLIGALALASAGLLTAMNRSTDLKRALHSRMLMLPWLGPIMAQLEAGRLFNVLGVLLSNGVRLIKAMDLTLGAARNLHMRDILETAQRDIRGGTRLSQAMQDFPGLSGKTRSLLLIGEESGELGKAVSKIGTELDKVNKARIQQMVSLAEPIVIITVGLIIALIVIGMLLGVYSLSDF